jgi:hypothetical protein
MAIRRNDWTNEIYETVDEPNKYPTEMFSEQTTRRIRTTTMLPEQEMTTKQNGGSRPRAEMTQSSTHFSFFSFVRSLTFFQEDNTKCTIT